MKQFSRIDTYGHLPDGRIIHRIISDPKGMTMADYLNYDQGVVTAFGSSNARTVGTPMEK